MAGKAIKIRRRLIINFHSYLALRSDARMWHPRAFPPRPGAVASLTVARMVERPSTLDRREKARERLSQFLIDDLGHGCSKMRRGGGIVSATGPVHAAP